MYSLSNVTTWVAPTLPSNPIIMIATGTKFKRIKTETQQPAAKEEQTLTATELSTFFEKFAITYLLDLFKKKMEEHEKISALVLSLETAKVYDAKVCKRESECCHAINDLYSKILLKAQFLEQSNDPSAKETARNISTYLSKVASIFQKKPDIQAVISRENAISLELIKIQLNMDLKKLKIFQRFLKIEMETFMQTAADVNYHILAAAINEVGVRIAELENFDPKVLLDLHIDTKPIFEKYISDSDEKLLQNALKPTSWAALLKLGFIKSFISQSKMGLLY